MESTTKTVKVYSTESCPYCRMAKDFLDEKHIPYESVNVGRDRNALLEMRERSGQLGVPVIDINGKIIIGFDRDALSQELGIK